MVAVCVNSDTFIVISPSFLERAFCLSVKGARVGIVMGQYGAPQALIALGTNDIDAGRAPVE